MSGTSASDAQRLARLALLAAFVTPPALLSRTPAICTFRRLTGRPCPTCGMTRSWNALAHLRLRESITFHPLGPATFVAALVVAVLPRDRLDQPALRSPVVLAALALAWSGTWLARLRRASRGQ